MISVIGDNSSGLQGESGIGVACWWTPQGSEGSQPQLLWQLA